ncbi:Hsp70 family protein [Nocardia alni]|uniref:Hsp70 family protein n=1 Tax=Nocardia alni TaxID=2815723 RepID=UPI001C21142A|nr:Hsp70 family protein [Nocardia alni]
MTVGLGVSVGTVNTVCATTDEEGSSRFRQLRPDHRQDRPGGVPGTWRTTLTFDSSGAARVGRFPKHGRALTEFADLAQRSAPAARVGHRALSAADLVATVVRGVIEETLGEATPDVGVAVSHPVGYSDELVSELREALAAAGLPQATLVAEPVAALAWLDATHGPLTPGLTLVYDLGGSGLSVTLARVGAGAPSYPVVGEPLRSNRYGGRAFGALMAEEGRRSVARARMVARVSSLTTPSSRAGESGSASPTADPESAMAGPGERSLADSDAAITDLRTEHVRRSLELVYRCLRIADVTMADVDRVLVVGGAARPREVAAVLAEELARPVIVAPDPERTIAEGAAIVARREMTAAEGVTRHGRIGVGWLPSRRLVRLVAAALIAGAGVLLGLIAPDAAVSAHHVVNGVMLWSR